MGVSAATLRSLLLIDLLPHDICVKTGSTYLVAIPKGAPIPSRKTVELSLSDEKQKQLKVEIYRRKEADEYSVELVWQSDT